MFSAVETFGVYCVEFLLHRDPSITTLVFIFLLSRSGESLAIWRRKFTVPPSEQLRQNLELRRVAAEAQRRGQVYEIDLKYVIIFQTLCHHL